MKSDAARLLPVLLLSLLGSASCLDRPSAVTRVVIVTFDTTRADRIGCYGSSSARTPNLDQFAEEAVLFESAVSPVPTTLPSHTTMFTGVYPQDHGVRYNLVYRLAPQAFTLAEALQGEGYRTAAFPSAYVLDRFYGMDQGFDHYDTPPGDGRAAGDPDAGNGRRAGEMVDRALAWLRSHDDESRQFVWVHFYDPHVPYQPPFPYSSEFRERPYEGEIAYADASFGRLLDWLRASPRWNQTLLIVAGDHGEGLHDHGERLHGNLVYETTQHVPLIVRVPGIRARRVEEAVGLVDVMPTVLDLVGAPVPPKIRGVSLRSALRGRRVETRDLYFESLAGSLNYGWAELRGLRFGNWKLIDSTSPELYDLEADPGEQRNLASLEGDRVEELRAALAELAKPLSDVVTASPAHDVGLDAETERFLATLGYVAGGSGGSAAGAPLPRDLIDLEAELLSAQGAIAAKMIDRVEEVCRYVIGRDPSNKWALSSLSLALIESGRPAEAQDYAAELVRLYPDQEPAYVRLAEVYRAQKRYEEARAVLERGVTAVPESSRLVYFLLVTDFDLGRKAVCAEGVARAVADHPRSPHLRVLEARCAARAGDPEAALKSLDQAVALGLRQLRALEQSEEFAEVTRLPGFAELVSRAGGEAADPDEPE